MHSISIALERLRSQLAHALPATAGLCHFDVSFPLNDAFDPLAWLGVQSCYPQFYWQQLIPYSSSEVRGMTVLTSYGNERWYQQAYGCIRIR